MQSNMLGIARSAFAHLNRLVEFLRWLGAIHNDAAAVWYRIALINICSLYTLHNVTLCDGIAERFYVVRDVLSYVTQSHSFAG